MFICLKEKQVLIFIFQPYYIINLYINESEIVNLVDFKKGFEISIEYL